MNKAMMKAFLGVYLVFSGSLTFAADTKISALTELAVAPASGDLLITVDVSDTTMAASGTNKRITTANFFAYTGSFGGNAATATALAANGANCSAGSAPLGVDASGAVESCTAYAQTGSANTFTAAQTAQITDAGTTTVVYPIVADHQSTNTPANGFGVGRAFDVETTPGNTERGATLEAVITDTTATSEDFALVAKTMVAGSTTLVEGGRWVGAQYLSPDGTAAAPSHSFVNDPDIGLYRLGSNQVGIAAAFSTLVGYWDSNGLAMRLPLYSDLGNATLYGFVRAVEANTGTKTPSVTEAMEWYTNTGDTDGSAITLPNNPGVGACYSASLTVAQTVTITPNTGETLYMGADQCVTSMTASGIGASVNICASSTGNGAQWHSFGASGWTCND